MATHTISVTDEMRYGMRQPEVRVKCACGWEDKAQTSQDGKIVAGKHLQSVVNEMKPQKSLDI